jgi:lipopolysaccharide biosynthesis glycosyltransferase
MRIADWTGALGQPATGYTLSMNAPETIAIVCALDNSYVMPMASMVASLLHNLASDQSVQLFIIDGGIQPQQKSRFTRSLDETRCQVNWMLPQPELLRRVERMTVSGHIALSAYYRILIPELLPEVVEKVIYLDCDLIVLGNLKELWDLDLQSSYLLAAQDTGVQYVSSDNGLMNYRELRIPPETKYFNSGVLVINLKQWRQDNICWEIVAYIENNISRIRWHDQDALNAVLFDHWQELPPWWNQIPAIYDFQSWQESPFPQDVYEHTLHQPDIVHFATSRKPWNSFDHRDAELFYDYLDRTAWRGWRLTRSRQIIQTSQQLLKKAKTRAYQQFLSLKD